MKFSTRSQYGLRAMINLAKNYSQDCFAISEIAQKEDISHDYLERLMIKLKKAKLVESKRGVKGGYRLSRKPDKITVKEIIYALEGPIAPVGCVSKEAPSRCPKMKTCGSKKVWEKLRDGINNTLDSITLNELLGDSK